MPSRNFCTLPHKSPKCPRRFREIHPEILQTCLNFPCGTFHIFFFMFFSLEMWHLLIMPKYPENKLRKPKHRAEKNNPFVKRLAGAQ